MNGTWSKLPQLYPIAFDVRVTTTIQPNYNPNFRQVGLFAVALALLFQFPAFGSVGGKFASTGADFFYFSLSNYTLALARFIRSE